jgi:folate-dependent phosphoribosylglycinamide formyltransferase PurN
LREAKTAGHRVAVVTAGGAHVWALVNALSDRIGPVTVILEEPESKGALLRARARRFGRIAVAGQLGTMVLTRLFRPLSSRRRQRTVEECRLRTEPAPDQRIVRVASADSPECTDAIAAMGAEVVLLNGCRLVSRTTLERIACPVLNFHAGITPKYRGMNGGYWALATGDAENFGATVHLVDTGVDTGGIVRQVRSKPKPGDSISSYAMTMASFSADACAEAIEAAASGRIEILETDLPSRQWYHPTIWFYLWTGVTKRVW